MNPIRTILLLLLLATASAAAQVGPSQPVTVDADKLEGEAQSDGSEVFELTGHVVITQGDMTIRADHATYYSGEKRAVLRGNITITQPGTSMSAPQATYNGNTGIAVAPAGVVVQDEGTTIDAGYGEYHTGSRQAIFRRNVTMRNERTVVTASEGTYGMADRKAVFNGNVVATNDSGTLSAQHLTYWRATEEAHAAGNVRFFSTADSTLLEADIVRHRPNVETNAYGHVRLRSYRDSTLLVADTLRHRPDVETMAHGDVALTSEKDRAVLTGDTLRNYPDREYTVVTGSPRLVQIDSTETLVVPKNEGEGDDEAPADTTDTLAVAAPPLDTIRRGDSLFTLRRDTTVLTADVLERYAGETKRLNAIGHAHMTQRDLETTAGVIHYFEDEGIIALGPGVPTADSTAGDSAVAGDSVTAVDPGVVEETPPDTAAADSSAGAGPDDPVAGELPPLPPTPIIWHKETQLTGDTMTITLIEKKLRTIDVVGNAFAVSATDLENRYDQLAADRIRFNVLDDTIRSIDAEERAASVYFIFDDERPDGLNRSSSDTIVVLFDKGKAQIIDLKGPRSGSEGEVIPEVVLAGQETRYRLEGFVVYRRPSTPPEPTTGDASGGDGADDAQGSTAPTETPIDPLSPPE